MEATAYLKDLEYHVALWLTAKVDSTLDQGEVLWRCRRIPWETFSTVFCGLGPYFEDGSLDQSNKIWYLGEKPYEIRILSLLIMNCKPSRCSEHKYNSLSWSDWKEWQQTFILQREKPCPAFLCFTASRVTRSSHWPAIWWCFVISCGLTEFDLCLLLCVCVLQVRDSWGEHSIWLSITWISVFNSHGFPCSLWVSEFALLGFDEKLKSPKCGQ